MTEREAGRRLAAMDSVLKPVQVKDTDKGEAPKTAPWWAMDPSPEAITWKNPLTELMEAEELAEVEFAKMEEEAADMARREFQRYLCQWVRWVFAEGLSPLAVVRRVFAWAKQHSADVVKDLDFRKIAILLDESPGTLHARIKVLFGEVGAGWKKTASARRAMAAAKQGNCDRLGGERVRRVVRGERSEGSDQKSEGNGNGHFPD